MTWMAEDRIGPTLLTEDDPSPVTIRNGHSVHPVLLVCEHAGQAIPAQLSGLGLEPGQLDRHIGWDIGAGAVTCRLASMLDAPAILQHYSRLVIDCNRPPSAPDSIPEISDGTLVPGNQQLTPQRRNQRITEIFAPFHNAVAKALNDPARQAVFSIHSFTPVLGGINRPWNIGLLYRQDSCTSMALREMLQGMCPSLQIGMNEPYQVNDHSDWFVPVHGEPSGLPHSLIELRNDQVDDDAGQLRWAQLLHDVIVQFLGRCQ